MAKTLRHARPGNYMEWIRINEHHTSRYMVKDYTGDYWGFTDAAELTLSDGTEWIVCIDDDTAGEIAKKRWTDMVEHDPDEFVQIVGSENLVKWSLGQLAGPGDIKVRSLEEWFELVADHPSEDLATYDGNECYEITASLSLAEKIGFMPTVAYRTA